MRQFQVMLMLVFAGIMAAGSGFEAQPLADSTENRTVRNQEGVIPLRKITIYSSGVSFFEHSRTLQGPAVMRLPFKAAAVNDALKSLLLNDPASASPQISYPSERSLGETLRSLGIDLSGNPGMAEILGSLRGEEVEILAPEALRGRIIAADYRGIDGGGQGDVLLSLFSPQGLRSFNLMEIGAIRFTNTELNADLNRALDLIMASRNSDTREITVSLPGTGSRPVSISYVIPSPVWKVSYRLDLGDGGSGPAGGSARFQGWAIVDNDSDEDWRDVELSLAAGRPVSFIQNLYPPYYLDRPTLPLAIAGSAAPVTWDSATAVNDMRLRSYAFADAVAPEPEPMPRAAMAAQAAPAAGPVPVTGADMADQFSFTLNTPVNLDRRTSAMFPLSDGEIGARKFLIFSGAQSGRTIHPGVGAELDNTTGLRLPAGPITVYDGGSYAGDALLEFLNRGEKRFISWGEDLSVTGVSNISSVRTVTAVNLSGGVMTISRRQGIERRYQFKNAGPEAKTIVIEHPITQGAVLTEPENYDEATATAYRFIRELPAGEGGTGEAGLLVREEIPLSERVVLTSLRSESLISYSTNQELPADVRASLARAVELRQNADDAERAWAETEARKNAQTAEQDRIRRNLEAAGGETPQGQEYLRRLTGLDADIDRLNEDQERQRIEARNAQAAYDAYLRGLSF
ncbi:MAG: DUF4139 domain-containing protein [Treponema sp.]|jgi:hypothetical protein|nr:DUF4139 domain-containing protein [Treponema sp.]